MKPVLRVVRFLVVVGLSPHVFSNPIDPSVFSSQSTIIGFEDLGGGNCNGCGTIVTNQYSLFGVIFENPSFPDEATVQTNLTFSVPNASGVNILYVRQGGLVGDAPADPFQIFFSSPVHRAGFNFLTSADALIRLQVFNGNLLVESVEFAGDPAALGWGGFAGLQSLTAFTRLEVSSYPLLETSRTLNFAFDNLQFEAIPEPSSMMLGLIGLACVAWKGVSSRGLRR